MTGEKSSSIPFPVLEKCGPARDRAPIYRNATSLQRVDDLRLGGAELRMNGLLDGAQPLQEFRLVLVDGDADRLRLFRAVLAIVRARQHRKPLHLAAHRNVGNAVD